MPFLQGLAVIIVVWVEVALATFMVAMVTSALIHRHEVWKALFIALVAGAGLLFWTPVFLRHVAVLGREGAGSAKELAQTTVSLIAKTDRWMGGIREGGHGVRTFINIVLSCIIAFAILWPSERLVSLVFDKMIFPRNAPWRTPLSVLSSVFIVLIALSLPMMIPIPFVAMLVIVLLGYTLFLMRNRWVTKQTPSVSPQ